jgi:mRNA interferase RelE/StbE
MAKYQIEISKTAEKQLKKIDKLHQIRIVDAILQLSINPAPFGSKKLAGFDDVFRIRIGNYRVIYSLEGKKLLIIVLKIGHRKDVYR